MENCGQFVFYNNIYISEKPKTKQPAHCLTCYIISMVYTLIDHSSQPISA